MVFGRMRSSTSGICNLWISNLWDFQWTKVVPLFNFCDLQLLGCAASGIFNAWSPRCSTSGICFSGRFSGWSRSSASVIFNLWDMQLLGYSAGWRTFNGWSRSSTSAIFNFGEMQPLGYATSGMCNSASAIFNFSDVQPLGYSTGGPAVFSFRDMPFRGYSVGVPLLSFCDHQLLGFASGIFNGWSRCSTSAIFNFWDSAVFLLSMFSGHSCLCLSCQFCYFGV